MRNLSTTTIKVLTCAIFTLALSSLAHAQATRTWVSGVGADDNPCSRTAPCKTYAGAISKTAKDGEISTLDPGGFGTLTITKSLTVNGGGGGQGYGSMLSALSPQGVLVNITDAADVRKTVRLNHLDINGASTGTDGVRWIAGLELHIENTHIDGLTGDGVDVAFSAVSNSFLSMKNVTIRNCGGTGVKIAANTTGTTLVSAEGLNITRCVTGFAAQNGTRANISRSVINLNTTGVTASEAGSGTVVNIDNTTISSNSGTGISVTGGSRARIARCVVAQNGTSLSPAASVDSGGNNNIVGNTANNAPAGTPFTEN
jgi:hypothetical protein